MILGGQYNMKCLHILPMDKLSGAEKLVLILCKNMKNYEPIVICGGDTLSNVFKENGIESYSMNFSIKNINYTLSQIKRIIKENEIKVIHAHDNNASINALLAKKIFGLNVKIISHIHSCYPWLSSTNKNKIIDYLFRKRYDHNIACGSTVYDFYRENTNYVKICLRHTLDDIRKGSEKQWEAYSPTADFPRKSAQCRAGLLPWSSSRKSSNSPMSRR